MEKSFSGFPSGTMLMLILAPAIIMQKEAIDLCFLLSSWLRNASLDCAFLGTNMFASVLWTICCKYNLGSRTTDVNVIN